MAATASAELIAGLERTVRVGPARSNRMLHRVIDLLGVSPHVAEAG